MCISSQLRRGLVAVIGFCSAVTSQAVAGESTGAPWLRLPVIESPLATIHLRKLARMVLNYGKASADNHPIALGPARARLLWQKKWKWPEAGRDQKLAGGLIGGPVLSVDVPFGPLDRLFSLETRLCTSRYEYPDLSGGRMLLDELGNPGDQRQSLEAGLYLNLAFDGFF
jgi:hypothetical protein